MPTRPEAAAFTATPDGADAAEGMAALNICVTIARERSEHLSPPSSEEDGPGTNKNPPNPWGS